MLKTVKTPLLFVICTFFSILSQSQPTSIRLPSLSPLPDDIKLLIADYPNHFANVLGNETAKDPQSTSYDCAIKISGAEKSTIILYSSAGGNSCGWEGLMLTTENFEVAKKKYKSLFGQLNNLSVSSGGSVFHFTGKYDDASEEKKFAGSVLSPDKPAGGFKKLRLEVSLQYEMMEWRVRLLLYDKEREDSKRGKTVE